MGAQPLKVALVHDWLTEVRGSEAVLAAMAEIFPSAHLFTLFYFPDRIPTELAILPRTVSRLQNWPQAERRFRYFLPFLPRAIESFDLSRFDLVISSSRGLAKGVIKRRGAVHLSYVHAPMRAMWEHFDDYFGKEQAPWAERLAGRMIRPWFQKWDSRASWKDRVDAFAANSRATATDVQRAYARPAEVIYPFVDFNRFNNPRRAGKNYLLVSRFSRYKRVDIAIAAFNRLKLPLLVVGSGPEEARLRAIAGKTIDFLGPLTTEAVTDLYTRCKAVIVPGAEGFGTVSLEAMASGAPVVAYQDGGTAEALTEATGVLFGKPSADSLADAVMKIENSSRRFDELAARKRAYEFNKDRFMESFVGFVRRSWTEAGKDPKALVELLARGSGAEYLKP